MGLPFWKSPNTFYAGIPGFEISSGYVPEKFQTLLFHAALALDVSADAFAHSVAPATAVIAHSVPLNVHEGAVPDADAFQ